MEQSSAPELSKRVGRKLVGSLNREALSPAAIAAAVTALPLGDAAPQTAQVGWLQPAFNRVPQEGSLPPLLQSGKLYATGIYAHAPARHVYELGGKWKRLEGEAGLHTAHQPFGSVRFVINADGKEVFRSGVIRGERHASYKVDLQGVRTLELLVQAADDGNSNDWGLWLEPILFR